MVVVGKCLFVCCCCCCVLTEDADFEEVALDGRAAVAAVCCLLRRGVTAVGTREGSGGATGILGGAAVGGGDMRRGKPLSSCQTSMEEDDIWKKI